MCGISGIVGPGADLRVLEAMVASQAHRGPDDSGVLVDPEAMVALGHNRLSIIDLSTLGRQPMASADESLWIVFNGEIYNYLELRSELAGYRFRSMTDTEVILAAYERWGEECVQHFIGMFAFAIWDRRQRRLFCARDRLGVKPFHYAWTNGRFSFASEIKGLLAGGVPAVPNRRVWGQYLAYGHFDHTGETFFAGVNGLPPGHTLLVDVAAGGRIDVRTRRYWDLAQAANDLSGNTDSANAARLWDLMLDSVRLRRRSDVPVGVNLSGGLDSAAMMAAVEQVMKNEGQIHTFTFGFDDPRYDEIEFAATVPRNTTWVRHRRRVSPDECWSLAEDVSWHQEAPFGGVSSIAYHALHGLAMATGVTVLLEGQGGDELFAGYEYFRPLHSLDLLRAGRLRELRRELRSDGAAPDRAVAELRGHFEGTAQRTYQDRSTFLASDCVSPELKREAGDEPDFPRPFPDALRNAMYRDVRYTKLPRVLRINDRASMAFGRELRQPYLDHRIVEFAFGLPSHMRIRDGVSKIALREAVRGRLPEPLRTAGKRAVVTPQREWLRGPLQPRVRELIESRSFAERGLFETSRVRETFDRFCAGEGGNSFFVWQWINTELWFRMFADRKAPVPAT